MNELPQQARCKPTVGFTPLSGAFSDRRRSHVITVILWVLGQGNCAMFGQYSQVEFFRKYHYLSSAKSGNCKMRASEELQLPYPCVQTIERHLPSVVAEFSPYLNERFKDNIL